MVGGKIRVVVGFDVDGSVVGVGVGRVDEFLYLGEVEWNLQVCVLRGRRRRPKFPEMDLTSQRSLQSPSLLVGLLVRPPRWPTGDLSPGRCLPWRRRGG